MTTLSRELAAKRPANTPNGVRPQCRGRRDVHLLVALLFAVLAGFTLLLAIVAAVGAS